MANIQDTNFQILLIKKALLGMMPDRIAKTL